MVLFPDELKVSRSLRKTLARGAYETRFDTAFRDVIEACAAPRDGQAGTWIVPEMVEAYARLHELGFAHSVESWQDGELVGGLYGMALGKVFFGESMFTRAPDASKVALVKLVERLRARGLPRDRLPAGDGPPRLAGRPRDPAQGVRAAGSRVDTISTIRPALVPRQLTLGGGA